MRAYRSKYHAKRTTANGLTFDSRKEAARYQELALLEKTGKIKNLECQVRYELLPGFFYDGKKVRKIEYVADFRYLDAANGKTVVEDVKGFKTDVYKLKRKLFLYRYGDDVIFLET